MTPRNRVEIASREGSVGRRGPKLLWWKREKVDLEKERERSLENSDEEGSERTLRGKKKSEVSLLSLMMPLLLLWLL